MTAKSASPEMERLFRDEFAHDVLRFAGRELRKAEASLESAVEAAENDQSEEAQARLQGLWQLTAYWRVIKEAVTNFAIDSDLRQPPRLVDEQ